MPEEKTISCFAEMLIKYIDSRLCGNLSEAYMIKRKLLNYKPAEAMVCNTCNKLDNKGEVLIGDNGELIWQCYRCKNMEIVRKNILFPNSRREGN